MNDEIVVLCGTAALIGLFHTLLGPDHYLPFLMLSKAGNWSKLRTIRVTAYCGIGHVISSILLGIIGMAAGLSLERLEIIDGFRGEIAGWLLISFGFLYMVWGLKRAYKNKPHSHFHLHEDGSVHTHTHCHKGKHIHVHEHKKSITEWTLLTIFVLGPCEPLIPILMFPAATHSISGLVIVSSVFALVTIGTMISVVGVSLWGFNLLKFGKLERYTHALAGFAVFVSGIALNFFGM